MASGRVPMKTATRGIVRIESWVRGVNLEKCYHRKQRGRMQIGFRLPESAAVAIVPSSHSRLLKQGCSDHAQGWP